MAKLYIQEYVTMPFLGNGQMGGVAQEPCIINSASPITISGTAAPSTAFNDKTKFIRVHTDTACYIKIGAAAVATVAHARMAANTTEYFGVLPGDRLSAITD